MNRQYMIFAIFFTLILLSTPVSADTFTIIQSSINAIYIDTDTLYGGNSLIVDKVSSTFGDTTFDTQPLVRYNLGSNTWSYYSQRQGGTYLSNNYNSTVWNTVSYGLYPTKTICSWLNIGSYTGECGGIHGVNTYWKSSSLELYIQRFAGTNPYFNSTNFTVWKRDNINNYWVKITDFIDGQNGLIYNGQIYLQSTYKPFYNLLNINVFEASTSHDSPYQPQHLNTTNNGWLHDTNYNGFSWGVGEDIGRVWKVQKSSVDTNTKIFSGRWVYEDTYPNGDAYSINTSILAENNQDLIRATWYNGDESRYIWSYNSGTNIEMFQTDGWVQQPSNQWYPINLQTITDITSCVFIKNYANVELTDIDCKDNNECVFVGHWNDGVTYTPLLVKYDGSNCQAYTLTGVATNSTIESVVYESNTDAYYVGGRKLIAKFRYTTDIGNGTGQNNPLCMPNTNNLCVEPFIVGSNIYCDIEDVTPCAQSCINVYNASLQATIGSCYINDTQVPVEQCPTPCNIIGQRQCYNSNSYQVCGLQGNCYGYGGSISCGIGEYCNNGYCYAYTSGGNGTTNISINPQVPFTIGVELTNYTTIESQNNKVTISSPDLIFTQRFSVNAPPTTAQNQSYASWVCNYNEYTLFTQSDDTLYITPQLWAFPQFTNGYVEIDFKPNKTATGTYDIYFSGNFGSDIISHLIFINNISSSESCLYRDYSGSIQTIDCYDYSSGYFDGVKIGIFPDFNSQTYTVKYQQDYYNIYSPNQYLIYTEPLFFEDIVAEMSQIDIVNTDNQSYQLVNISVKVLPAIPSYSLIVNNVYGYVSCSYSQEGCFPLRVYYNTKNSNSYNNYKDISVCATLNNQQYTFTGTTTNFLNDIFGGKKDTALAVFIVILVFIVSAVFVGGLVGNTGMAVGLASILSVAVMIVFAYFGWIPIWWLILFFILAGGIVVMMVRGVLNG